jgi:prepilin-type N-terminal cleavage/methylation domain-containing protein
MYRVGKQQGFTIVELLIVVVVIAILAAIIIVSYNGITNRANVSAVQTGLQQASKKISLYAVDNSEAYPDDSNALSTLGVIGNGDLTYQYSANNTSTPKGYCVTASKNNISYYIAVNYTYLDGTPVTINKANPTEGTCPGQSQAGVAVTNFSTNPSIETDASGFLGPNGSTYARSTAQAYQGAASLLVTMPIAPTSNVGVRIFNTASIGGAGTLKASTGYVASAYVYVPSGTTNLYLSIQGAGASNAGTGTTQVASAKNQWVRIYNTFNTTSSGAVNLYILNNGATTLANTQFWVDAIMVTEGSTPYSYADGETAGWSWNGTQHLSTSTRPAQ